MSESKSKFQVTCLACGFTADASSAEAGAKAAEKHGVDSGHATVTENVIGDGDGAARTQAVEAAQRFKDAQAAKVVTSAQIDAQEAKNNVVPAEAERPAVALADETAVAPAPEKPSAPAKKTAAKKATVKK